MYCLFHGFISGAMPGTVVLYEKCTWNKLIVMEVQVLSKFFSVFDLSVIGHLTSPMEGSYIFSTPPKTYEKRIYPLLPWINFLC